MGKGKFIYVVDNNERDIDLKIIIEPWAAEYTLKPKQEMKIEITFTEGPEKLEIGWKNSLMIIWLWSSCVCRVFIDKIDCTSEFLNESSP